MSTIRKIDTDGNKSLLDKAQFGFDDYDAGGDQGRVYIGDGNENIPLAKKVEVDAKLDNTANASLVKNGNILTFTDIQGNTTDIDLSIYLDDTNLARLVGGTLDNATGIATFSRDDGSTFTLDLSALLDDTRVTIIDNLTTTTTDEALSAKQGFVLDNKITAVSDRVTNLETELHNNVEW